MRRSNVRSKRLQRQLGLSKHSVHAFGPSLAAAPPDFEIAATKLQRETAYLSQLARGNDPAAFDAQFEAVNATCNSCHDQFRERD